MKKLFIASLISATMLASTSVIAKEDNSAIMKQLEALNMPVSEVVISNTPFENLKEIGFKDFASPEKTYMSKNADMLIMGKVFQIKDGKVVDFEAEKVFKKLKDYEDTMIVNKAPNEKYVVTAFVDITCHYCNLLHQQAEEYKKLGITLRYLAYPREGLDGNVAKQMESIFTQPNMEDRLKAYTDAENGKAPEVLKTPNIVKKHYQLGQEFGITGTPALITPEGQLIPGYLKPEQLLQALKTEKENK